MRALSILAIALAGGSLGGCVDGRVGRPDPANVPSCDVLSITSPTAKIWLHQQRWRYANDAAAAAAYAVIAGGDDPWPNWFIPHEEILPVGTRFEMAIGQGQPETSPGAFGTFDDIRDVRDVRRFLAVKYAWKPIPDRVVTYEVIKPLPAKVGPIGPQADAHGCRWEPGRWSQLEMTSAIAAGDRMQYLKVLGVKPIH